MHRRIRVLPMILAAMVVGSSSCVWVTGSRHGDVTIFWSFDTNHMGCQMVPEVTHVTVRIPGQILENGGTYGCMNGGLDGITLLDFAPGTYSYTVQGKNDGDFVLYESSGSFTVNGSISVDVVLLPPGNTGGAYLTWTLAGGSCSADLDVTTVRVTIDSGAPIDFACTDGQTQNGVLITYLAGGEHQITLAARTALGFTYYYQSSTLRITPGSYTAQQYELFIGGGLALRWNFGQSQVNCAQAQVDTIYVNLIDANNTLVYADPGLAVPCDLQNPPGLTFEFLYPGTYRPWISAQSRTSVVYSTSSNPQALQVVARSFPSIDTAPTYTLMAH